MTSYGWTVEDQYFVLLDVQLVGIYESEKTIEKDESLFAFAVANIMEELAKDVFKQFTVLNHYDSSVGLFIVIDKEKHADERSEEHTSELQSRGHIVCRLLLEKNNKTIDS